MGWASLDTPSLFFSAAYPELSWADQSGTGTTSQQDKLVAIAEQMKTEVGELLIVASETRRQVHHMANETATVRLMNMEIQLTRGEILEAKAAAVVSASKLTFLDLGERPFFIFN